ncbi:MAG: hypothetical protein Q7S15_01170 [bacterium]|nr:hypothetical protein [bacterium]
MKKPSRTVRLCKPGGCPTVTIGKIVVIRDDYGGKVRLTKNEWQRLCKVR